MKKLLCERLKKTERGRERALQAHAQAEAEAEAAARLQEKVAEPSPEKAAAEHAIEPQEAEAEPRPEELREQGLLVRPDANESSRRHDIETIVAALPVFLPADGALTPGAAICGEVTVAVPCHIRLWVLCQFHQQTEYSNKLAAQQGCWLLMGLTKHPKPYMTWHCSNDFSTYGCTWGQRSVSRQEDRQRSHNGFNVMPPAALIHIRPHQQPLLAQLLRPGLRLSLLRLNGRLCSSHFRGRLYNFLLQPGCSLSLRLGLGMGLQRPLASPFCFLQSFTQQLLHLQKPVPPQQQLQTTQSVLRYAEKPSSPYNTDTAGRNTCTGHDSLMEHLS